MKKIASLLFCIFSLFSLAIILESSTAFAFSFYIDKMAPTFGAGFFRGEYPLIIDSTTFTKNQLSQKTHIASLDVATPIQVELMIFEETGPHDIVQVTLHTNIQGDEFEQLNDTFILWKSKNPIHLSPEEREDDNSNLFVSLKNREPKNVLFSQLYAYSPKYTTGPFPHKYSFAVNDPHNIFSNVDVIPSYDNRKLKLVYNITFAKTIPESDIIILATDNWNNTIPKNVVAAWKVE